MNKLVTAVKKAVASKKVAVKKEETEEKKEVSTVCTNCENSGMECNTCGGGKDVL